MISKHQARIMEIDAEIRTLSKEGERILGMIEGLKNKFEKGVITKQHYRKIMDDAKRRLMQIDAKIPLLLEEKEALLKGEVKEGEVKEVKVKEEVSHPPTPPLSKEPVIEKMNSIEGKIDGLVKRLDLQGEEINKLKAGEDEIRKDIKKQEETGKRIEQLEKAINELNRRFLEAKSEGIEELKRDLELQKKVIGELKMREERIRKDIQSLNQRFSGIPGGKTETPETTQLEKRIDSHESAIKKLQKSLEVLRIAVESSPSESVELSKFKIEMESRLRLLEKRMGKENG